MWLQIMLEECNIEHNTILIVKRYQIASSGIHDTPLKHPTNIKDIQLTFSLISLNVLLNTDPFVETRYR